MSDDEMEQKFRAVEERCTELENRLSMLENDLLDEYDEGLLEPDLDGVLEGDLMDETGTMDPYEGLGMIQEEDLV